MAKLPADIRDKAKDIYYLAKHYREVECIRDYSSGSGDGGMDTGSGQWPKEDQDLETKYLYVYDTLERFTKPAITPFDEMAEYLQSAKDSILSKEASYLSSDTSLKISDWRGDAKIKFDDNYITPWDTYRDYHAMLVEALKSAAEGHAELYRGMRDSAWAIGDAAYETLSSLDPAMPTGLTWEEATDSFLSVAGLLLSKLASNSPLGKIDKLINIIAIAGVVKNTAKAAFTIEGEMVDTVMDSMVAALDSLEEQVLDQEKEIANGLNENLKLFNDKLDELVPPSPELAKVDPDAPGDDLEAPAS